MMAEDVIAQLLEALLKSAHPYAAHQQAIAAAEGAVQEIQGLLARVAELTPTEAKEAE